MPIFIGAILSALGFLVKNPIALKMAFFATFVAFLYFVLYWIRDLMTPYIIDNAFFGTMAYFGFFDALNVYLMILVAGWASRKIIGYVSGT